MTAPPLQKPRAVVATSPQKTPGPPELSEIYETNCSIQPCSSETFLCNTHQSHPYFIDSTHLNHCETNESMQKGILRLKIPHCALASIPFVVLHTPPPSPAP